MMPKKKTIETQKEQSQRFEKAIADLVEAGDLGPIEAEDALGYLVDSLKDK